MAQQQRLDITGDLNNNSIVQLDIGGWDYAVVQLVSPTGTVTFSSTIDSGAIEGVSDGSAVSATNWIVTQGVNINSGTAVSTLATSGAVRFQGIGQFLQIAGNGISVTKAFVRLYKIS